MRVLQACCTILFTLTLTGCSGESDRDTPPIAPHSTSSTEDYLTPQLRAAVEALKRDVRSEATNDDNVDARMDTFWAWVNAMGRRDGGLKFAPNITVVVRGIRADRNGTNLLAEEFKSRQDMDTPRVRNQVVRRLRNAYSAMDHFVLELEMRESSPGIFGKVVSDTTGPFRAASFQTVRQTWHVGDRDLPVGGYLLVAQHFMSDQGAYQTSDPSGDNYVTVSSSNPEVEFSVMTAPKTGMHGGFRGAVNLLAFAVTKGALTRGDSVTVTYGDRSGGSRGFKVQGVSNDYYQLPLYVSFDGDHAAQYMLDLTAFAVTGAEVAGVAGFAPTVVAAGEPFALTVRSEDRYFNKATGTIPGYRILLGDKVVGSVAPDQPLATVAGLEIDEPGYYYFTILSEDGSLEGESNPIRVDADPRQRIYWGETHGHGGFAEGQGTPEGYFRFAAEESKLDFITLSEHDIWLDDGEWERLRRVSGEFHREQEFITYMGYEWTVDKFRGGHHNVLFRNRADAERVASQQYPLLSMLYEGLRNNYRASDVLVIPHAHQTAYWRLSDPDLEPLAEVHSLHGYFEWFGRAYLAEGYRIGFIAASDDHLGHPGYNSVRPSGFVHRSGLAAVVAPEKSTDAIFDALKRRATYATTIDRIILDASVNGVGMGGVAEGAGPRSIAAEVYGTAAVDSIDIVKNGAPIRHEDFRVDEELDATQDVEILFYSSSQPVGMVPDNPRAWRLWYGYLDVTDANVSEVAMTNPNAHFPVTGRDAAMPQRVHFATQTRGETERLRLRLGGVSAKTRIALHLTEQREVPTAPATLRPPQVIPEQDLSFAFADIERGMIEQELVVDEYVDSVTLKLVRDDAPRHRRVEFVDDSPARQGDSYYLRVEQANGGIAWSSPIFVDLPQP